MLDVFHTANNTYIITEYCDQGDLKELINKYGTFSEKPAIKILKQLLNGLGEMQNKGVKFSLFFLKMNPLNISIFLTVLIKYTI